MSENSTPEERTELPSDRRMGDLRKEGQVHASNEVNQALSLITAFMMFQYMWTSLYTNLQIVLVHAYKMIARTEPFTVEELRQGFVGLLWLMIPTMLMFMIVIAAVASLSQMVQSKWNVKKKKIDFKLSHLNPINGIKRVFSINGLVNTGKALFKLAIIIPLAYFALKGFAPHMIMLVHLNVKEVFAFTGAGLHDLFWRIMYVLIAFAIFDWVWSKHRWMKQNKMTKVEVKDERKAVEGDESTKRRIINKGLQRIMQRLTQTVPKADVVVTNPTHYSVALRYDRGAMGAPTVVAKGKGFIALRIREIAKQNNIPVLERKTLARALFASVEVGGEIPRDLFKAVAEVLAYVYRLKNPYRHQQRNQTQGGR